MAYATDSLNVLVPRLGGGEDTGSQTASLWLYRSDDAVATVIAAGYIDDGDEKGIQVNDVVLVVDNATAIDVCLVTVVAANGDVTMINGT